MTFPVLWFGQNFQLLVLEIPVKVNIFTIRFDFILRKKH